MHITDGALSNPIVLTGWAVSVVGLGLGLRHLNEERIPQTGVLAAVFFVASLIHVPIGASSVHLIMNGLAGLILGWAAFPALFVGLVLQALFFGFGGIAVLGVNVMNIALPAVLVGVALRPFLSALSTQKAAILAGIGGGLTISLTTFMVALSLAFSNEGFVETAYFVFVAHIPIMVVEGLLTAAAISLIKQAKPELLSL